MGYQQIGVSCVPRKGGARTGTLLYSPKTIQVGRSRVRRYGMNATRILRVVAVVAVVVMTMTAGVASATITWPANTSRTTNVPRLWSNYAQGAANQWSGTTQPGLNSVAMSNNTTINFIHYVGDGDGSVSGVDYNNLPGRTFKYPYFGGNVSYGGNDAPMTNLNATGATPYYDGDCGVMRPHLLTDDFGTYKGAWTPERAGTTATATLAPGGVMTLTSDVIAHMNKVNVGDRIQLGAGDVIADPGPPPVVGGQWVPAVFNRTATGLGPIKAEVDPLANAPYWRVTGTPAWNQITAVPDAATPQNITAASFSAAAGAKPAFMQFTSSRGGVSVFQGVAPGQRVTVTGMTPSGYNGTWIVGPGTSGVTAGAPSITPNVFRVLGDVNGANVTNPGGPGTVFGAATRITDNFYTHSIASATESGTTATFTTHDTHGLVGGSVETVVVSGMTPGGYNGTWTVLTAPTATTFTATMGSSGLGTASVRGIATVNTATATVKGTVTKGSDCARVVYARSTDDGTTWDGGRTDPSAGGAACTVGSATCGVTDAFNIAGGPTGGGVKTVLSEMSTGGAEVQAYQNFVFVTFFSISGAPHYPADVCPNDPRVMYLRVNNAYGAWDAWGPPIAITPAGSQANYPTFTVDQANGDIYVLATDATSGLMKVYRSVNQGGTWTSATVDKFKPTATSGFQFHSTFMTVDDPSPTHQTGDFPAPCVNASRNLGAAGSDSWGYGLHSDIAAYNGFVGVTYIKNLAGDKVEARISSNSGATWPASGCPASSCAIVLAKGGAGGLAPGFGAASDMSSTCPWPYSTATGNICLDDRLYGYGAWRANAAVTVTAGAAASGSRIDFAWVQDGGVGQGSGTTVTSNGLYFKEWTSVSKWAPTRLVACSQGNAGGPASVGSLGSTKAISGVTTGIPSGPSGGQNQWTYTTSVAHGFAAGDTVHIQSVPLASGGKISFNGNFTIFSAPTTTTFIVSGVGRLGGLTTDPKGNTKDGPGGSAGSGGTAQLVNGGTTNDPCVGSAAAAKYSDFKEPVLKMWGTSGVGVAFTGCPIAANGIPCSGDRTSGTTNGTSDPGSQILYKESGNSGALWGADWSVKSCPLVTCPNSNGGAFQEVTALPAVVAPATDSDTWRISQAPDLAFDTPADSATGCTQVLNGSPNVGCKRYVFFIGHSGGANPAYQSSYVQFLMTGVQS